MQERPILFSEPMVRAIISGAKTETRRVVSPQPSGDCDQSEIRCPYGETGDRLWVRERFAVLPYTTPGPGVPFGDVVYYADDPDAGVDTWRPSIHMPRWASRITLEVDGVAVERLSQITEMSALAEGIEQRVDHVDALRTQPILWYENGAVELEYQTAREAFFGLWDHINSKRGFAAESDPWVWAVRFHRVATEVTNEGRGEHPR